MALSGGNDAALACGGRKPDGTRPEHASADGSMAPSHDKKGSCDDQRPEAAPAPAEDEPRDDPPTVADLVDYWHSEGYSADGNTVEGLRDWLRGSELLDFIDPSELLKALKAGPKPPGAEAEDPVPADSATPAAGKPARPAAPSAPKPPRSGKKRTCLRRRKAAGGKAGTAAKSGAAAKAGAAGGGQAARERAHIRCT